jgi:hypothetical protein
MSALFAVVQRSLEIPEVGKLKRAFQSVKCLTAADAHTLANDAFGILVKNLPVNDAMTLQGALSAEGIETALVLQNELPQLPPIKFVRRLDCAPESLLVYDPIGRTIPVPWGHVMLIAAGDVRTQDFERIEVSRPVVRTDAFGFRHVDTVRDVRTKEGLNFYLLLEIVLTRATMRFQCQADKLNFQCLGERATPDAAANFSLLVQDLMKGAPQALVNRGAFHLRDHPGEYFRYPSKNAFYEEITWMLWRAAEAASA